MRMCLGRLLELQLNNLELLRKLKVQVQLKEPLRKKVMALRKRSKKQSHSLDGLQGSGRSSSKKSKELLKSAKSAPEDSSCCLIATRRTMKRHLITRLPSMAISRTSLRESRITSWPSRKSSMLGTIKTSQLTEVTKNDPTKKIYSTKKLTRP